MLVQLIDGVASSKFLLDKPVFAIGRLPENDLYIEDAMVSGRHAVIEREDASGPDEHPGFVLRDLGSTNGTFVNDVKTERKRLEHHDVVRLGLHSFLFVDEQGLDLEKTKKIKKSWIPGVYYTKD